jgi:hypothetical protein
MNKFFKGWGYREPLNFHDNLIINLLIDTMLNMLRGISNIIDGLILIFSLGRFYSPLGFKAVVLMHKINRGTNEENNV